MDRRLRVGGLHRAVIGREQQQRNVDQEQGKGKGEEDLRHVAECQDPADQTVLQQHATTNRTGIETTSDTRGSIPKRVARKKLMYMPIITNSPWAKLTIFTTPKISVTPMLTSA